MNIIDIDNVSHRFADGTLGLDRVCLSVAEGSFTVVAGPNGSGKTTLLRHLNGLLLPTNGCVTVAGLSVTADPAAARRSVGLVFQDADSQIVGTTVAEDVAFGPENLRLPSGDVQRRVADALRQVGLEHLAGQGTHLLSGGEKRRLAIAGVLALDARVLALDEPFSNLDYPGFRKVLERIVALHRAGRTLVVATHDLEKVIAHADRLVIMNAGRVVRDGPPAELLPQVEAFGVRPPCFVRFNREVTSWLN